MVLLLLVSTKRSSVVVDTLVLEQYDNEIFYQPCVFGVDTLPNVVGYVLVDSRLRSGRLWCPWNQSLQANVDFSRVR